MGLKVISVSKNIMASIEDSFNGDFEMNLVIKLRELTLFYKF